MLNQRQLKEPGLSELSFQDVAQMTDPNALLASDLGNGALLTRNKQVCTLMSVWSYRPVVGEHIIF